MQLIFEKSTAGRKCELLPELDVPKAEIPDSWKRTGKLSLPEVGEAQISRHYTELAGNTYGVNNGFYPLGSCTMKYNPQIDEEAASLPGFTDIHPLQPEDTVQGCLKVYIEAGKYLCEITGMDEMTFQPAAGAHGELTGLMMIKAYHQSRGDDERTKVIIPDSAHGTNPAAAAMLGYSVVTVPTDGEGCVDIGRLKEAVGSDTAALMLTNPSTVGMFEKRILEITEIIHEAGGLNYYDGANLNAVMGITRPGDMGFDVIHLNLHKTFGTPHGGGGPGAGAVGCKTLLADFLPAYLAKEEDSGVGSFERKPKSIGTVKGFYGNFLVVLKAYTYLLSLGRDGISEASRNAVLNANYLKTLIQEVYPAAYKGLCMHEFVISLAGLKKQKGITAMDIAKRMIDYGMHPPTMYFPLIVEEALMLEPTETESKETLELAAKSLLEIYEEAIKEPEQLHLAPETQNIGRPDEAMAARKPVLKFQWDEPEESRSGSVKTCVE